MGWLWAPPTEDPLPLPPISIPLWDDCELLVLVVSHYQPLFQFHYGMIVSIAKLHFQVFYKYFNSTMGWLWAPFSKKCLLSASLFQFHYGMIVSYPKLLTRIQPQLDFNSTMGWLWGCPCSSPARFLSISIPLWDDCEKGQRFNKEPRRIFQFHYGMIVSTDRRNQN